MKGERMFSGRDLRKLLIPLIIEQVFTALMGTADTMMVARVGSAAVSGVSLVDSINTLVLYLLSALATGGTIICSQYIGRRDRAEAGRAAHQVILATLMLALAMMAFCLALRTPLLRLIYGSVEADVMASAQVYFLVTAISYPFIALFSTYAALYRAAGNSRVSMLVSGGCNLVNIGGNALLIFGLGLGVLGAALATLTSRVLSAVIMMLIQRRPNQPLDFGPITGIKPDFAVIRRVLSVGLPSGVENSMFQLGKLVVQSTVSTLGTVAIAANSIVYVLEAFSSMPSMAIGLGLVTVAGQCIGAGELEQAKYYIKRLTALSAVTLLGVNWLVMALTPGVTVLAGLEPQEAEMTIHVMLIISIVKPFLWPLAFTPANGMRAAGDVRYNMCVTTISMWGLRVMLATVLCRCLGFGLTGIWIGYFADWGLRSVLFAGRFVRGKWALHHVID
ncbi:MAG: MATE family efflux transporter [Oscillospiraceae bacterium]|nr:MATE family efflux transporter [Oscillospiraceae bacterium]